jgi:3',5'-cyclic AMP phosphodiesterase CpdA
MRFLHTSDIHLLDLAGTRPWHYFNKRATGGINVAFNRGRAYDERLFDRMMQSLSRLEIERVVITGDLTNLALESEFEYVRRKLEALEVPATVIPGNHDTYTRAVVEGRVFERYFAAFMQGEREPGTDYPFLQRLGDVSLVGVSTAVATLPFFATGRVGQPQLERLRRMLRKERELGRVRIVLIHHPVTQGTAKPRHDLLDLEAFAEVIGDVGAELILHGHEHRHIETTLPGPEHDVPVHGISSGTYNAPKPGREAGFSVYSATAAEIARELYLWDGHDFHQKLP